jgi:cytochrome c oxidase subunit 4
MIINPPWILWFVSILLMVSSVVAIVLSLVFLPPIESAEEKVKAVRPRAVEREAPPEPVDEALVAARRPAYLRGIYVFIGLAVLTAAEFGISVALEGSAVFLFVVALAKAGVILQYYMHVGRVWGEEEVH